MAKAARKPPGPLSREVAGFLRAEIARGHHQQGAVAKAADISPSTLSEILNDKKQFDIEQLDRACFALGFKLADVIADAEKATASRHAEPDSTARQIEPNGD